MAAIKLHTMWLSNSMWEFITICMIAVCATMNYMCHQWLYPTEYYGSYPQTKDQREFEQWLWIEYEVFWSTIFSAIIYGFVCFLKKP